MQAFKLARAVVAPFATKVVEREGASGCVLAILLGVTIVGLPFARQHLKLVPLALMPFGRDIEPA